MVKSRAPGLARQPSGAIMAGVIGCVLAVGCGVKDRQLSSTGGGSSGGGTGAAGNSDGARNGEGGNDASTQCAEGEMRCANNTPETCTADGEWLAGEECSGTTKVCTGAGVCAAYRLVNARIDGLAVRPAETDIILKEQTLSLATRHCDESGTCVTGGIR